jgi:hypothetical protein
MLGILRFWMSMFPSGLAYLVFVKLLIYFLPWPLVSIALGVHLLSHVLYPEERSRGPEEIYLPRLPIEVVSQIASHLTSRPDLVRFALASKATYHSANPFLYRSITLDEHPSPNIPWFRRRLYRLDQCLTRANASYIRHLDFSHFSDIDEKHLLSILKKCINLTSLSLPAIQEPIPARFGTKGLVIKQPVFLTASLSVPMYTTVTSLIWTGPFIPFRGPSLYAGRDILRLFRNLRSLKVMFRSDTFAADDGVKCANTYTESQEDADSLKEDLRVIEASCPFLEELIYPFWEAAYSIAGHTAFRYFHALRKLQFLALDGPMKDSDHGFGLLRFISEMNQTGIQVTFNNPWKTSVDITSLVTDFEQVNEIGEALQQLPATQEITFGPFGPPRNPWINIKDIPARLEWISPDYDSSDRHITLNWPITTDGDDPSFTIPPIFTAIQFEFNTPVRRGDARQFMRFRQRISEAVEFPHLRRIRVELKYVDAFYLAFPMFMQFQGDRVLTLQVERLLLPQREGWECCWIRRQWKIRRRGEYEEDVKLEDLKKDGIHVHPARLFERIMFGIMFCGERRVEEITCVFYDRYSRSRENVA